jgi:hypothetical protein
MSVNLRLNCLVAVISLILSGTSSAEINFIPRVEIGQSEYSIDFSGQIPLPDGSIQSDRNFFAINPLVFRLGGTVTSHQFFFDAYYQTSTEDTVTQLFPQFSAVENWRAKKSEVNFAIGRSVFENGYFFIGYRNHEQTAKGMQDSAYEFSHNGVFVGGSYGWRLTALGSLSGNLGYAWLNTKIKYKVFGFQLPGSSGEGHGIKFGIVWSDSLSQDLFYSLSYDNYRFDHHIVNRQAGVDVRVQEEETSLRLGLNKIF